MSKIRLYLNSLRQSDKADVFRSRPLASVGVVLVVLLWSYWTTLTAMADRWSRDPQYSHGFLVPVFASVVLLFRKDRLKKASWEPSLLGLPILLLGVVIRLYAIRRDIGPLDAFSLVPTLFGLVLFVGGKTVLRWSWPALAFLGFMVPLPYFLEVALAHPLRGLATAMSTYTLQTFGYPAIAEGNIILIDQVQLGVAEACSGLGMLMTFFALATALALVSKVPLLDRIVLVLSAVPIALIANVVRISATGIAYHGLTSKTAQVVVHDLSGWLMMPFALLLLWLELRFMSKLFVPVILEICNDPLGFKQQTNRGAPVGSAFPR
jgi:exosortase